MNYVNNLTFNDKLMKTEEKANLKSFSKPPAMQIRFWKKKHGLSFWERYMYMHIPNYLWFIIYYTSCICNKAFFGTLSY